MPTVSIALIKESNKRLASSSKRAVADRSSKLSREMLNEMMKRAFERLANG